MPRNATKAADNVFYLARKAAEKCNDHLGSREGAAEETGIDRTRLARIEAGVLVPYPEEVLMMAHTYQAPQLCKAYSYYTPEPVDVGDIVDIKTNHGTARAMVVQADVPEKEIAAFKPAVKTIIGKSACRCEECDEFTAIGEGDHICGADPQKMPVSEYTPTEDYFWCKGAHFSSMEG